MPFWMFFSYVFFLHIIQLSAILSFFLVEQFQFSFYTDVIFVVFNVSNTAEELYLPLSVKSFLKKGLSF